MATSVTVVDFPGSVAVATWAALAGAEAGAGAYMGRYSERTVQVSGTFGSATVVVEGSNDGTNWFALTKPAATAISFTAAGGASIVENPLYVRPKSTGGTASAILVTIAGR